MKKILILFSFLVFTSVALTAQTAAQNSKKWQQLNTIQNTYINANPSDTQAASLISTYNSISIQNETGNANIKQKLAARMAVIQYFNGVSPQHKSVYNGLLMANKN